jgi:FKBP-type peptidyl-prolyl cis-trans isomerase SlyD
MLAKNCLMEITNKRIVALRYIMKNSRGEELENIMQSQPLEYLHGAGKILPQLELRLEGMKAGEKKSFSFSDESNSDQEFYFDVIIDEVRIATEKELQIGKPIEKNSNECGPGCCC